MASGRRARKCLMVKDLQHSSFQDTKKPPPATQMEAKPEMKILLLFNYILFIIYLICSYLLFIICIVLYLICINNEDHNLALVLFRI